MVKDLHHIAAIASSEKTVEFYEKLGFIAEKRIEREKDAVVLLSCGDVRIDLFIDPKYPSGDRRIEQTGVRFISFCVDDLERAAEMFGVSAFSKDWNGEEYFLVNDPDGNTIQLHR